MTEEQRRDLAMMFSALLVLRLRLEIDGADKTRPISAWFARRRLQRVSRLLAEWTPHVAGDAELATEVDRIIAALNRGVLMEMNDA